jgi:hypothetical protein
MTRLASLHRSFPTVMLIVAPFRWIGKSRRRIWYSILILLAMSTAAPLWWATQLWGLPDIGDPFDVNVFREMTIPDERNAFVLYRQAAAVFKPLRTPEGARRRPINYSARWSEAKPEDRRWLEENRQTLALYRQGAERPDGLDLSGAPDRIEYGDDMQEKLRSFQSLALLEASRLEAQGDMAGAWIWHRTTLRFILQARLHGTISRRHWARDWSRQLLRQVTTWAADARTTPAMLRQAIDDVVASESLVTSESYSLKAQYLFLDRMLAHSNDRGRRVPPTWRRFLGLANHAIGVELLKGVYHTWRSLRREGERSRRLLRLATANWLAYLDLPPDRRPSPDPNVANFEFYSFGPEAPAKARILSPVALDRWIETSYDSPDNLRFLDWRPLQQLERADYQALLILLGTQIYRRDHGTDPPSPEALVGPYLKSLPSLTPEDEASPTTPKGGKPLE